MRVVFLGNAPWSVPSLEAVAGSSHEVALVLTRVPRPAGRGMRLTPTPVADTARRLELPLLEVETVRSGAGFDALAQSAPDVLAVVAYGEILPQAVLDVPRVAPVNVHFSLLPKLRGAAPVQRAILEGLESTGVTTIRMDAGMDTGPILLQARDPIQPEDDAGGLGDRLAALGGRTLVETLDGLAAGTIVERSQDDSKATTAPKLTTVDQQIHWDRRGIDIDRQVRALAPDPGAVTLHRGRALKVFKVLTTRRAPAAPNEPVAEQPGEIIGIGDRGPVVVTADDVPLVLEEVQPAGKRRMTGAEFVRGYRPVPGERLG
jgi:methionyl-tRNA formyltransferase